MSVIENVASTCASLGDVELSGIKLEDAKRELLDITHGTLDQHVAMQPAAIAYYLSIKKMLKRGLDNLLSARDRWEKKQYAVARAAIESGCTAKSSIRVEDVKARFIVDNEPQIISWEERIGKAQAQYDDLDSWCEAWKQKSFSLREYVAIEDEESKSTSSSIMKQGGDGGDGGDEGGERRPVRRPSIPRKSTEANSESVSRVRDFIRKRRQEKANGGV